VYCSLLHTYVLVPLQAADDEVFKNEGPLADISPLLNLKSTDPKLKTKVLSPKL